MDDTLTGLFGGIHHAVSLSLGGGNSARNLIAAVGKTRIADGGAPQRLTRPSSVPH
ncbi:hypothetical protein ACMT4L_19240 [Deinococcus sp. A31D244]|uniref:hypothetical protein n=1 Tax=Deinococcus sp. A31D244 TaxID=3397675 RepID=UPI0039E1BE16